MTADALPSADVSSSAEELARERFKALVARCQALSDTRPRLYRLRVLGLALLGYAFLIGAVIVLAILTVVVVTLLAMLRAGALARYVAGPVAALMGMVAKALWVRVPSPQGYPVTARQAPRLFAMLEEVRKQVRGPRVHQVLMDGNFNAAIVQVPRLGALGWQKNHLLIGLPLMELVPADEFRAVVAHEMGHLVGAHGRYGTWIHRQRTSWMQLLDRLHAEEKMAAPVFKSFADWYGPLFNAHTFVMGRAHEYHADRLSAEVTSTRVAANALTRVEVTGMWMDQDFWPAIQRRVREEPEPSAALYHEIGQRGRVPTDAAQVSARLEEGLARETALSDTHPSLKARLDELGEVALAPGPFQRSAAEALLEPNLAEFEKEITRAWHDAVAQDWKTGYDEAVAERKRMAELDMLEATEPLSTQLRWERACLFSLDGRGAEYESMVQQLATDAPDFPSAQAAWGVILLKQDKEEGLQYVDRALASDGINPVPSCHAAYAYLDARGRTSEAVRYGKIIHDYQEKQQAARQERASYTVLDPIEPHGLPEADLQLLRDALAKLPEVQSAFLARKRLQHFPESPVYVVAVRMRKRFLNRKADVLRVRKTVLEALPFAAHWYCLSLDLLSWRQRRRLEKSVGSPFYIATLMEAS